MDWWFIPWNERKRLENVRAIIEGRCKVFKEKNPKFRYEVRPSASGNFFLKVWGEDDALRIGTYISLSGRDGILQKEEDQINEKKVDAIIKKSWSTLLRKLGSPNHMKGDLFIE